MKTDTKIFTSDRVELNNDFPIYSKKFIYNKPIELGTHAHEFLEIGITLGGSAIHYFNGVEEIIEEGAVYIIPIGSSHSMKVNSNWEIQNIYILPKLFYLYLDKKMSYSNLILFSNNISKESIYRYGYNLHQMPFRSIANLLHCINECTVKNKYNYNNFIKNCLLNVIIILSEEMSSYCDTSERLLDKRIIRIIGIISENIYENTHGIIQKISSSLNLNTQYINKIFKNVFNMNISNYIIEAKIEKSIIMFLDKEITLTEISNNLSFYDHSHYNKYFKRHFNISPTEYRKKILYKDF